MLMGRMLKERIVVGEQSIEDKGWDWFLVGLTLILFFKIRYIFYLLLLLINKILYIMITHPHVSRNLMNWQCENNQLLNYFWLHTTNHHVFPILAYSLLWERS